MPSRTPLQPLQPTSGLLATPAEMAQILLWLVQPAGVGSTPGMLSEATIQAMLANHFPIGKTVRRPRRRPNDSITCAPPP